MLLIFLVGFIISFLRFHQKIKIIYNKNLILLKSKFQQEILQTQVELQEQIFKNISQELHDNIGQVLSLAKLNINTMQNADPGVLNEKIQDSKYLLTKAIKDLRDVSKSLNTDYVSEIGLIASVEYELKLIEKSSNINIKLITEGQNYKLEKHEELICFRIVQEALHNIIKHAKANKIVIQIIFGAQIFILKISDNGIGFDTRSLRLGNYKGTGMGIRNMYNRAKIINAQFDLNGKLNEGTTLTLSLPLKINPN